MLNRIFKKQILAVALTGLFAVGIGATATACSQENNVSGLARAIVSYFSTGDIYGLPTSRAEMDFNSKVSSAPSAPYSFANWLGYTDNTPDRSWQKFTNQDILQSKMMDVINTMLETNGITNDWVNSLKIINYKSSIINSVLSNSNSTGISLGKYELSMTEKTTNSTKVIPLDKIYITVKIDKAAKWAATDSIATKVFSKTIDNSKTIKIPCASGAVKDSDILNYVTDQLNTVEKGSPAHYSIIPTVSVGTSSKKSLNWSYNDATSGAQAGISSINITNKFVCK